MPIYEYHCRVCERKFEYLLLGADTPECPACQSTDVNQLMSACGFVSKGSGGQTTRASAADSSCGSCTASSCTSCGH